MKTTPKKTAAGLRSVQVSTFIFWFHKIFWKFVLILKREQETFYTCGAARKHPGGNKIMLKYEENNKQKGKKININIRRYYSPHRQQGLMWLTPTGEKRELICIRRPSLAYLRPPSGDTLLALMLICVCVDTWVLLSDWLLWQVGYWWGHGSLMSFSSSWWWWWGGAWHYTAERTASGLRDEKHKVLKN